MRVEDPWIDLLTDDEDFGPLVSPEEVEDVVALIVDRRIDIQRFIANLHALLTQGRSSSLSSAFSDVSDPGPALPTTDSIHHFTAPLDRPFDTPLWVLAAFPDVIEWYDEKLKEMAASSLSEDEMFTRVAALYGVDAEADKDIPENCPIEYRRVLIDSYQSQTGKTLETRVVDGSPTDMYLGLEIMNELGEESNFTLIARITTTYYMAFKTSFHHRFPDETALLSAAGILDALVYVSGTRQLDPNQIVTFARETEGSDERLLDFMIPFEALVMSIETPELTYEEVRSCCEDQSDVIERTVRQTMTSYCDDPSIAIPVHNFMTSPRFSELRNAAGIRPDSIWARIKRIFVR